MNILNTRLVSCLCYCFSAAALLSVISCRKAHERNGTDPLEDKEEQITKQTSTSLGESERRAGIAETSLKKIAAGIVAGHVPPEMKGVTEPIVQVAGKFTGSDPASRHSEAHVFKITNGEKIFVALARIELKAKLANGRLCSVVGQLASKWVVGDNGSLLLQSLKEAAFLPPVESPVAWFEEQTGKVIGNEPAFLHHLSHGIDHWLTRVEAAHGIDAFIRNGMALGDIDGDNRDDVYICQPGGLPNRLFLHQKDGRVKEIDAGVGILDHTSAALFVDIDNDNDQDLVLATPAGISLFENEGSLNFAARGVLRTNSADCHALAAADYNLDGNLDLYITFALGDRLGDENNDRFLFHDAQDGGANQLFRGDGDWSFTEATESTGLHKGNNRHSLAATWHDFDLDGDPDLYVANDYGANQLYRNDAAEDGKRIFTEVATMVGVEDKAAGMSASWGDFNRDGRPDLYVGNMYSNAGSRITSHPDFPVANNAGLLAVYSRFAKGNTLLSQTKPNQFIELTDTATMGRWAWSSLFADLDNDGWQDLFVANGYITATQPEDL
ncbi:MAG: VCBS repeat-containing protein [Verrucomicrobiaceae bacterium]|nr:VCBS repeat-containing protein [Verrucomicrobiaceae bacterium]